MIQVLPTLVARSTRVRLYDLRHTMATLILNDTKDIKLVASRLGHANEYLVLRRYGHLLPGFDQAATARLSDIIRAARPAADGTCADSRIDEDVGR